VSAEYCSRNQRTVTSFNCWKATVVFGLWSILLVGLYATLRIPMTVPSQPGDWKCFCRLPWPKACNGSELKMNSIADNNPAQ